MRSRSPTFCVIICKPGLERSVCKRTHLFRSEYGPVFSERFKNQKLKGTVSRDFKMKEMRIKDQIHMRDKRSTRSSLSSFLSSSG